MEKNKVCWMYIIIGLIIANQVNVNTRIYSSHGLKYFLNIRWELAVASNCIF